MYRDSLIARRLSSKVNYLDLLLHVWLTVEGASF